MSRVVLLLLLLSFKLLRMAQHRHYHHQLQALRTALFSLCTADVSRKHERRNECFQFGNLVDASQEHAKPQLLLVFQDSHGATAVAPNSTVVEQHFAQHSAAAVHALAFVTATTVFSVCRTRSPQLAAGDAIRILQQYVCTYQVGTLNRKAVSRSERGAKIQRFVFLFGCLRCLLLCTCITPKAKLLTLWQPCMVPGTREEQPHFKGLLFTTAANDDSLCMRVCVRITWAHAPS